MAGNYGVFISHCGLDCKRNFAVWLLRVLENVGVRCFFDDRCLEVGDDAANKMLEAMEMATYGIVILSAGFFEREWCMKELQTFARRERILPIFFGTFEEVQRARDAAIRGCVWQTFKHFVLTEDEYCHAAQVSTHHTGLKLESMDGYWDALIYEVRYEVLRLLRKLDGGARISEADLVVGQQEHLVEIKELLGVPGASKASNGATSAVVRIVGVKGMGGVGKTTLAKKLYDESDVRTWFMNNICWVRVGPEPSLYHICNLQKHILAKICGVEGKWASPEEGRAELRDRLWGKRVLICLDDVWEDASIAEAVVRREDLDTGSRIFKTSRVKEAIDGVVHNLDVLQPGTAWELFCWHAFGGEEPVSSLANAAQRAAERCAGLPLALTFVGRQVRGAEDTEKYLSTFLELPRDADAMINCRSIIKASIDRLPGERLGLRDTFVLIAGLWPNTPEFREWQRAVENIGAAVYGEGPARERESRARGALEKLRDLSLIGVAKGEHDELITVHDLIVEVAQSMRDSVEEGPTKFIRYPSQAEGRPTRHITVLSGVQSVDCLGSVASLVLGSNVALTGSSSSGACKLLFADGGLVDFQRLEKLQCLHLRHYEVKRRPGWAPLWEVPCTFILLNLLPRRLLKGIGQLTELTTLELSFCTVLRMLPAEIGRLTGLTRLDMRNCTEMRRLPAEIGGLTGLTALDLSRCYRLTRLPAEIVRLTGLTRLDLSFCGSLQILPEVIRLLPGCLQPPGSLPAMIGLLTRLATLYLRQSQTLKSLPEEIELLTGLMTLKLRGCHGLIGLPEGIERLTGLMTLDLGGCSAMRSLPEGIERLTRLTTLDLSWCKALESLPEGIGQLMGLVTLKLHGCTKLTGLPEGFGRLTGLMTLTLSQCKALESLPEEIGRLTGLTTLDSSLCFALENLPEGIERLWGLFVAKPDEPQGIEEPAGGD
jgi:Leucine-rich repeat (LRR) protein